MNLGFEPVIVAAALWAGAAPAAPDTAGAAPPSEQSLAERAVAMAAAGRGDYLPEIRRALAERRFASAESQASAVIDGPPAFANPQRQSYVRSLAYLHRAEARRGLHADQSAVNADVGQAALLGNLEAIRTLVQAWVSSARDGDPATARPPAGVPVEDVLAAGVELDEVAALKAAAGGFGRYSAREREVFAMRYQLRAHDSSFVAHVRQFAQAADARDFMRAHFLVGADIPASDDVPGRDVLATFSDESNLRSTISAGLGFALPASRPEHELSLREIMEVTSWLGDMSGLATAYHFVPDEPGISARHVVLEPRRLGAVIGPGDTVNVRCGGIAHAAVVLRVDRARDEVVFADPLYEYWQPANNDCISSFSLVHYKYGYYVAALKLSEVLAILDSVQSARTFAPPSFVDEPPSADAAAAAKRDVAAPCQGAVARGEGILGHRRDDALKHDLFRFFNFEQISARTQGGATVEVYMVRALEFRGDVLLRLRTRDDCVASASLFLRRSFLEGDRSAFANDLMKSFMNGVYDEAPLDALQSAMVQPAAAGTDGREGLASVLSGAARSVAFRAAGREAEFGNVTAESGARWLRLDGR